MAASTMASDLRRQSMHRSVQMAMIAPFTVALRVTVLGLCLSFVGCTARTLPLPPPELDPLVAPNAQGLVRVAGTAQEGAAVGVLNEATNQGLIVTSTQNGCDRTCKFEALVAAHPGDSIRVWQFYSTPAAANLVVPK
ncbi:MAG: hypothetical protein ACHQ53_04310 [Polyangiales bacterium]